MPPKGEVYTEGWRWTERGLWIDLRIILKDASGLCGPLTPEAEADVNLVKADFNVWMEPNRSTPVYTFKDNQYSYSYKAEKTAHKSYLNTVDIKISYQVDSTITYENDTVHFVTSIVCTGKINADGGTVKGTLYDSTLTYHVRLGINPFGTLCAGTG